jgi:hypothetical protein
MRFQGALITEQGVTFAIIMVKSSVLSNATERSEMRAAGKLISGIYPYSTR